MLCCLKSQKTRLLGYVNTDIYVFILLLFLVFHTLTHWVSIAYHSLCLLCVCVCVSIQFPIFCVFCFYSFNGLLFTIHYHLFYTIFQQNKNHFSYTLFPYSSSSHRCLYCCRHRRRCLHRQCWPMFLFSACCLFDFLTIIEIQIYLYLQGPNKRACCTKSMQYGFLLFSLV